MNVEYVKETKIVYFRRIGSYGIENRDIMQSFKRWVKSENLLQGSTILGIALDNPQHVPAEKCRYDVCLITNENHFKNNEINQRTLKSGSYAVFKILHTEIAINEFYQKIGTIISDNQLKVSERPIIERYQKELVDSGFCEIMIPIE
ncbi:GyrI-like domain-containing protein [Lactiplantibacillus plantarum]|uniref:GyrI-like domain-containing protein n=1 Tax=Lactiplantibacillus plantarum TaxID=1590 RepID=UPI0037DDC816